MPPRAKPAPRPLRNDELKRLDELLLGMPFVLLYDDGKATQLASSCQDPDDALRLYLQAGPGLARAAGVDFDAMADDLEKQRPPRS
jgi:hypothetical protein